MKSFIASVVLLEVQHGYLSSPNIIAGRHLSLYTIPVGSFMSRGGEIYVWHTCTAHLGSTENTQQVKKSKQIVFEPAYVCVTENAKHQRKPAVSESSPRPNPTVPYHVFLACMHECQKLRPMPWLKDEWCAFCCCKYEVRDDIRTYHFDKDM